MLTTAGNPHTFISAAVCVSTSKWQSKMHSSSIIPFVSQDLLRNELSRICDRPTVILTTSVCVSSSQLNSYYPMLRWKREKSKSRELTINEKEKDSLWVVVGCDREILVRIVRGGGCLVGVRALAVKPDILGLISNFLLLWFSLLSTSASLTNLICNF